MQHLEYFIALAITVVAELVIFYYIRKRVSKHNQLITAFKLTMLCMMLWCIGLMVQILAINFISLDVAIYIDYFIYLPVVLTPVALFFIAYIFIPTLIFVERILIAHTLINPDNLNILPAIFSFSSCKTSI